MTLYDKLKLDAFDSLNINHDDCDDCKYLKLERDPFMTGDSPSELVCNGDLDNCPRQDEIDELIAEDVSNKLHEYAESDCSVLMQAIKSNDACASGRNLMNYLDE